MAKPVGGRGIKAPYESTHVRVPVPIKPQIDDVIERFREAVTQDLNLLTGYDIYQNINPLTGLENAKKLAIKHLKAKREKHQMMANLLSDLYQTEVRAEELK
ncbi:hypothetical protein IQ250_25725 [Pseudanabaenaceae cyanobacterium LEGE 13415]|nr:hypothetical protein [Pseudanabaenaceae cyanobacterium LEGE 13415]